MAESKKTAKAAPIADVAKPGKSAPADNSRSLVISRPILQDPMMVDDKAAKPSSKPAANKKVTHEITIQPLVDVSPPDATDEKPAPPDKPVKAEKPEKEEAAAFDAPKDGLKTDQPSPAAAEKAKQIDEEAEQAKQVEHDAEIQEMIDSKKYFLPIKTVEQRKSARFVALGIVLALLLIVAWADVALDAGLIQIDGIKPVTHLFSS